MKFRAHDTFAIRKGWLHKGMRHVLNNPRVFIDKDINQMDELGMGANMVKALRYWLQAVGLTTEAGGNTREQVLTPVGQIIWDNDSYIEEDGTLYILHYMLASNKELATSWYYFFNQLNSNEIDKQTFVDNIKLFIDIEGEGVSVANRSLEDDFDCIIKTYIPTSLTSNRKDNTPENNTDSPLCDTSLITINDKKAKTYKKATPRVGEINPLIVLAVILNEKTKNGDQNEIKINRLERESCNIGKIFNLDSFTISNYLDRLSNLGYIKVVRTAGLDIIKIQTDMTFVDCVAAYYQSLNR